MARICLPKVTRMHAQLVKLSSSNCTGVVYICMYRYSYPVLVSYVSQVRMCNHSMAVSSSTVPTVLSPPVQISCIATRVFKTASEASTGTKKYIHHCSKLMCSVKCFSVCSHLKPTSPCSVLSDVRAEFLSGAVTLVMVTWECFVDNLLSECFYVVVNVTGHILAAAVAPREAFHRQG